MQEILKMSEITVIFIQIRSSNLFWIIIVIKKEVIGNKFILKLNYCFLIGNENINEKNMHLNTFKG